MSIPIVLAMDGPPPSKNEAKSMLSTGHPQAERVEALLRKARDARGDQEVPFPRDVSLRIDVEVFGADAQAADGSNVLGGIGDVLQARRTNLPEDSQREAETAALFEDDAQIDEIWFRRHRGGAPRYEVTLVALDDRT